MGFFLIGTACSGCIFPAAIGIINALDYYFNIIVPSTIWLPIAFASFVQLTLYWGAMYYKDIKEIINNPKEWEIAPSTKPGYIPAIMIGILNALFVGNFSTAFGGMSFLFALGLKNPIALQWSWILYLCSGTMSCASFSLRTAVNFYTKIVGNWNKTTTMKSNSNKVKTFFKKYFNFFGSLLFAISSGIFAFISSLTTLQLLLTGSSLSQFNTVQDQVLNNLKSMPKASKLFGLFGFTMNLLISLPFSSQSRANTKKIKTPWWIHFGNAITTLINTAMMLFFNLTDSSPLVALGMSQNARILYALPMTFSLAYYGFFQLFNLPKETLILPLKDILNFHWHEWIDTLLVLSCLMISLTIHSPFGLLSTLLAAELMNTSSLWEMISKPTANFTPKNFIHATFVPFGIEKIFLNAFKKTQVSTSRSKTSSIWYSAYHLSIRLLSYASSSWLFALTLGSTLPVVSASLTVFSPQILSSINTKVGLFDKSLKAPTPTIK